MLTFIKLLYTVFYSKLWYLFYAPPSLSPPFEGFEDVLEEFYNKEFFFIEN